MNNNGNNPAARGGGDAGPPCGNAQCAQRDAQYQFEINRLNTLLQLQRTSNRIKINRLKALLQLKRTSDRKGLHTKRTWPDELRKYLRNCHQDQKAYLKIYRLCCKEENMSVKKELVHPDIELAIGRERAPVVLPEAVPARDGQPFPFEKLPWKIQAEIFKLILHKPGEIIHCLSRLDPFVQPDTFPEKEELGKYKSGLIKRFFWGKGECSITHDGVDPQQFLSILTVSRRFYFLGVHVFYGLNTFGFSSLGELGRFCQGSGHGRIARVQHIELLFTGNQYLTCPPDKRGKVPMSRRTYAVSWLTDMYRLKTLVVHINETGSDYIRRGDENPEVKGLLGAKTRGQPNRRMSRSLRCVQGIDYIYQLRGMEWIRFYDFNKVLEDGRGVRVSIQDWSFADDVTRITTMPKAPKRQETSQLERLPSLFPQEQDWTPGDDDWALVKSLFIDRNGRCSYDDLRRSFRDADLGSHLSVVSGVDSSADEESSSDSEDESDSSSEDESSSSSEASSSPSSSSGSGSSSGDSSNEILRSTDDSLTSSSTAVGDDLDINAATQAPSTHARRASTASDGLFVSPGPNLNTDASAHTNTNANANARSELCPIHNRLTGIPRRASTTSGLFVTPEPSGLTLRLKTEEAEKPTPWPKSRAAGGGNNAEVIDLTLGTDDDKGIILANTAANDNHGLDRNSSHNFLPIATIIGNAMLSSSSEDEDDNDDNDDDDDDDDDDDEDDGSSSGLDSEGVGERGDDDVGLESEFDGEEHGSSGSGAGGAGPPSLSFSFRGMHEPIILSSDDEDMEGDDERGDESELEVDSDNEDKDREVDNGGERDVFEMGFGGGGGRGVGTSSKRSWSLFGSSPGGSTGGKRPRVVD